MMASASAESVRAREEKDEAENVETANPEEHVAFLAKWGEGKTRATAHICNHICLSSSANISRALVSATAKAAVYSSAGKIFGDAKTSVPALSAELVGHLVGDKGGGVLSDLQKNIVAWCETKKTLVGSVFGTSQSESIETLTKTLQKGEGWPVADRERTARELLLRYDDDHLAHCEEAFETGEELLRHKHVCSFRPTQCPHEGCVEVFSANVARGHDSSCPHKLLQCPLGCDLEVPRRLVNTHVAQECDRRPAECPFQHMGCDVSVDAGTLETHCRTCVSDHLVLVAGRLGTLGDITKESDAKHAALSVVVADCAGRLTSAARQMDGLEMASLTAEKTAFAAIAAAKKTEKEHDTLLAGVFKAIAGLEAESKKQRKEITVVVAAVEKLSKAHESAVKAMATK